MAPNFGVARDQKEAEEIASTLGYPVQVRPCFPLALSGEIATCKAELISAVAKARALSPADRALIEHAELGVAPRWEGDDDERGTTR